MWRAIYIDKVKRYEMLKSDAEKIYKKAILENMPNEAVKNALAKADFGSGRVVLISVGKAGWEMAKTAYELLGERIDKGVVITKYDHIPKSVKCKMQNAKCDKEGSSLVGHLGCIELHEAGHPVVDFNGIKATKRALEVTKDLGERDTVLFLVSGGGSALFESVSCPLEKMQALTKKLLECGANINEINALRKHISDVKGGKFATHIYPASVFAVVLSDVVGNDLSTIASGPATADTTTVEYCLDIVKRYGIELDSELEALIKRETPKEITNATHIVSGSVSELCISAKKEAERLGYRAEIVRDTVTDDAAVLSEEIKSLVLANAGAKEKRAYIFGGEITIKIKGNGKGGRNQELALLCGEHIKGKENMAVFCVGSDGTDGPTDAAGGFVLGDTYEKIAKSGKSPEEYLKNNDSYNALALCDGLIFTGATGTNVNDLYVLLINGSID